MKICTCKHSSDHCLVQMSNKFIPPPSARSIGAYWPKNKEQANELTKEIRSVCKYASGRSWWILRIWNVNVFYNVWHPMWYCFKILMVFQVGKDFISTHIVYLISRIISYLWSGKSFMRCGPCDLSQFLSSANIFFQFRTLFFSWRIHPNRRVQNGKRMRQLFMKELVRIGLLQHGFCSRSPICTSMRLEKTNN